MKDRQTTKSHWKQWSGLMLAALFVAQVVLAAPPSSSSPKEGAKARGEPLPSGTEIYQHCGFKYPGHDQRSTFTVMIRDRHGRVRKSVYERFWKDFEGRDGIADKMMLFTTFPPEARGSAFLRVAYTADKAPPRVDQWIYLPALRKIRRVSIRDPGDSFLNSNLTYADVSHRAIDEDTHRLVGVRNVKGLAFYVVESIPKEKNPLYGKRIFWFLKTPKWDDCVNTQIQYYNQKGDLIKDQFIKWQKVDGAWTWDRVLVRSHVDLSASVFIMSDVHIDTGLDDALFSVRTLKRGLEALPPLPAQGDSGQGQDKDAGTKPTKPRP